MSIFISIISPEKGYIVADSRATGDDGKIDEDSMKIFRLSKQLVIGTGGDASIGNYMIKKFRNLIHNKQTISIDQFVQKAKAVIADERKDIQLVELQSRNTTFIVLGIDDRGYPARRVIHTDPTLMELQTNVSGKHPLVDIEPPPGLSEDECLIEFVTKLYHLCPNTSQATPEQFRDAARLAIQTLACRNQYINNKCQDKGIEGKSNDRQNVPLLATDKHESPLQALE